MFMRYRLRVVLLLLAFTLSAALGCQTQKTARRGSPTPASVERESGNRAHQQQGATAETPREIPTYTYEVVNAWPHDSAAFTQGLIFHDGAFFESTGQHGASSLRKVDPPTGKILKKVNVPGQYFAEGITLLRGKIFQLTWTTRKGFIYDPESFQLRGEFAYDGEGWGLTHDGEHLVLSDGTNQIRFLDPSTFEIKRSISVDDRGLPLRDLNELEYVKGEIYANVWHKDLIVRIDPRSGRILGWIDLAGLLPPEARSNPEAVLNGIAYDEANDRLFVTGKLWPKIFEVRLKKKGDG
jgi:glutamine cyclotransferase